MITSRKYSSSMFAHRIIAGLLAVLCLASSSLAGVSNTTVWDVRTTGSDSANGGGFDPLMSAMATDLAATSATGASPVVTSASYNFTTRDNGAWLFIRTGTNWTPGWYQILSTSGNAATLTAGIGTGYLYVTGPIGVPIRPAAAASVPDREPVSSHRSPSSLADCFIQ